VQSIGTITGTGVPRNAITVYHPAELLVFAASGLAIAAAGALLPASWKKARAASCLGCSMPPPGW
jgi:putative ABC transport system permease protein